MATDGRRRALIGVVASLFGGLLFVGGVRSFFTSLSLYRTATTPVREIPQADGAVEFGGQAEPTADGDAFEAPFSGEEALLCAVWMEQKSRFIDDEDDDQ